MAEVTPPEDVAASVDPGPYRRAAWKVRLAIAFFVLVLVAVTGEGLARLGVRRDSPVWLEHPLCWRVLAPDLKLRRGAGDKAFDFETNHLGFRGKSLQTEKRPATAYRIVFLGDDATLAPGTPEGATFPGMVEAALSSRRTDPRDATVEVANAGGTGFFAPVVLATLVHRVLPLEPDMVVVMTAVEDVKAALANDWDERGTGFVERSAPPAFGEWLCGASDFAYVARRQARRLGLAETPADPTPIERLAPRSLADPARGLPAFRRQLHLMADACAQVKAELVLVTQPTLYKEHASPEELAHLPHGADEVLRKGVALYNEELRAAAPRCKARLVDMASLMTCDLDRLQDDVHFTAKGHAKFAEVFVDEVFKDKAASLRR